MVARTASGPAGQHGADRVALAPGPREGNTVEREALVEVGNAGAFAYSVNGRPGRPLGDVGQVKTLKLTPATAAQYMK